MTQWGWGVYTTKFHHFLEAAPPSINSFFSNWIIKSWLSDCLFPTASAGLDKVSQVYGSVTFHPVIQPPRVQHSNNITSNIYWTLIMFKAQRLHFLAVCGHRQGISCLSFLWLQIRWFKTTEMYSLTVLETRSRNLFYWSKTKASTVLHSLGRL